ncbi:MAG: GNAT family N-acetyltransferase [Chloroflexi bacterium]|nr:GNAT family N-acetyltransferase [Chloroflexota bacterium]
MLQELKSNEFKRVRPLFQGFDYSLSIHAAIEGNNPGRIFVDDAEQPRTAFALTVEGYLLAGEYDNPATNKALHCLLREKIFTGEVFVNGDLSMSLAIHPENWEAKLLELIPTHEVEKNDRYHYLCRTVKFDWRNNIPEGYTIHRVDRALLDDAKFVFSGPLGEWMDFEEMWWTVENFLSKGVSFCVIQGQEIVSWCTCDCVAGNQIDVGIITHPAHRRRGLAAVTVAATVEHCLSHGFSTVGWHCNARNIGSVKTAEKVGFKRNREYAYYYYMYDPVDHLAELGWHYYRRGEYAKTAQYYEQVFALRDENPDYYYHLVASAWALLGNREKAIKYLLAALDHGWTNIEWTSQQEEFSILHSTPEWNAILARINQDVVEK